MSYIELIEEGKLFVLCRNKIEDDEGVYCLKGKEYEVIDIGDNDNYEECFLIQLEDIQMQIKMDDPDFLVVIK